MVEASESVVGRVTARGASCGVANWVSLKEGSFSVVVGGRTRRALPWLSATLTVVGTVIGIQLTESFRSSQPWVIILAWVSAGIIITYLLSRVKARSDEDSPEATKARVGQLQSELRMQVQSRSYGARSKLIAAPLKKLNLDITPRVGLVRDPRLAEPEPISEKNTDIVAAFTASKRRLLIVGEPGAGKTIAAYSLIEYLDETEGVERVPLLVNLSAWQAQENFEAFLVDYLVSEVGYQVRKPAVARAFIHSPRYNLVLDGLDEIPAGLRTRFSERLDKFLEGLPSEVAVVVTCRTQEYQELREAYTPSTSLGLDQEGLGLVQAVEIRPLTSEQLDSAFTELAKVDSDWETFLTQRHLKASQRARDLLSNPLFLNLAVIGRLRPRALLKCDEDQDLRALVLERYLDRVLLVDQSQREPKDVRRYLTWIARFLNGDEVSPFGLKTTDATVFDLADLTPPDPPRRYRLFEALAAGLVGLFGMMVLFIVLAPVVGLFKGMVLGLVYGLILGLLYGPIVWLLAGRPFKRSAVRSRLALVWPSTRRQLVDFLSGARRGLVVGIVLGMVLGLVLGWGLQPIVGLVLGLELALVSALIWGLAVALVSGLVNPRSVLISARTPKEANSRSLVAALIWLVVGLVLGMVYGLVYMLVVGLFLRPLSAWFLVLGLILGLVVGVGLGLGLGLRNGGGFVLLQKVAHRRLAQAGNLPPRPGDFLEWGIERQIFRRVGGGVRFRHSLLQQHLASTSVSELL